MLLLFSITWGAVSGWWFPVCVVAGVLYAWLMYKQPTNLSYKLRLCLALLRAAAITVIALLLLSPLIKSVNYQPQKPLVLVVQDNSASVQKFNPKSTDLKKVVTNLYKLQQILGNQYDVREFHFNGKLQNGLTDTYNGRQTDIAATLHQLNEQYVNQNIGAVILATDGLYNQGADPLYEARNLKASIYTVALGDTTIRRDLLISNVNYNKTALLGNDFELEVMAGAYLGKGENIKLTVSEDGRQVASKSIAIASNNWQKTIPLKLNADKKGLHRFTFSIAPVSNEVSVQNNVETVYIEVLDARQKILLVYNAPHPDIGAIKQSVAINRNYELKVINVADVVSVKLSDYNLLILNQVATAGNPAFQKQLESSHIPVWFMAGAQTNVADFNQQQKLLQISAGRLDDQEVFALPQPAFSAFTLSDSTINKIGKFPPLLVPFGTYTGGLGASVLLRQKIVTVTTNYPLLMFEDDRSKRTAVLAGEGLWRWQLAEYETYGNHNAFNELISQTIQYLTANSNRQRFRVYTAKNVFDEGAHILLNAELYNEALVLTNAPDVKLDLKEAKGKSYSYQFSRAGQSYQLDAGALAAGDYTYTATTQTGKQPLTVSGRFTVKATDLEAKQSTADHQLLQNLAKASGGQMLKPDEVNKLADLLRHNDNVKTLVNEDRRYTELIDIKWVFVLVIMLLSAEWFLRKREGEV